MGIVDEINAVNNKLKEQSNHLKEMEKSIDKNKEFLNNIEKLIGGFRVE